jgi:hypothetical protein
MYAEATRQPWTGGIDAEIHPELAKKVEDTFLTTLGDQPDLWHDGETGGTGTIDLDGAIAHVLAEHAEDGERRDERVSDLSGWTFDVDAAGVARLTAPDGRQTLLRHTAFAHLCERAKAPAKYLRQIPTRYALPALGWGIERSEAAATVRYAGPVVRAILSHRYTPLDDSFALPKLRESFAALGLLDKTTARVIATGLTTLVRMSVPSEALPIGSAHDLKDVAEIAIDLTNGEVGNRALSLAASVYLRNSRLSVRRTNLRLRHLGDPERLAEEFATNIPTCLAEARKLREQVVKAIDKAIDDSVAEAEKLRSLGLSIAEAREVLRKLADDKGIALPQDTAEWDGPLAELRGVSALDVVRAICASSDGRAISRRLDLEEAAAKYLAKTVK